jgi:type I restriction enzyme, S subunit
MRKVKIKEVLLAKISGEWGKEGSFENGVAVIRTANFTNKGEIDFSEVVYRDVSEEKVEKKKLQEGDLIIEKSGRSPKQPVGRVVYFNKSEGRFLCNNFTSVLRPNKEHIFPKYFLYAMMDKYKKGETRAYQNKTTGIINLKLDDYLNTKLLLPSPKDQIHIATILSKAEALIKQREESIALADEFLKMKFLEMFGELFNKKTEPLIQHASVTSGLTKGKKYGTKETSMVPYMRVANVQDGFLDLNEIKCIEATNEEVKKYNLKYNDLLLTEGGDPDKLGRGALWKDNIEGCIFQNHIFRVRVKSDSINPTFLSYLTGSSYGKSYFLKSAKQTTGIASINSTQLKNFPLIIPSEKEQLHFAQIVEKMEKLKTYYKLSLLELQELYGSLSKLAFHGKLTLDKTETEKFTPASHEEIIKQIQKPVLYQNLSFDEDPNELDPENAVEGNLIQLDDYLKTYLLKNKSKKPFTFEQLWQEVNKLSFDFDYDWVSNLMLSWLQEKNSFIKQQFNTNTKQMEFVINETAEA